MPIDEDDLTKTSNKDLDTLAAKIEEYYNQDMTDKLLRAQGWDEAIRYVDGDMHIEYNVSRNSFQQVITNKNNDFIPKPVTNYILPAIRTIVSLLTKQKPQAIVRPNSKNPKDIAAAKIGDLILDIKHEELKEDEKIQEKAYWGVITGTVFKKIFWNETTNKILRIPKKEMIDGIEQPVTDEQGQPVIDEFNVGDIDDAVIPPFNIAMPFQARSPLEIDWIMEYSIQKIDWIKEQYDKKEEGYTGQVKEVTEERDLSNILQLEYKLRSLSGRKTGSSNSIESIKNSVVLKEYYEKPSSKHSSGRMIVVANGKTLFAGDNPYYQSGYDDSWNPYVQWNFEIIPGRVWGKGLVEELIPVNRRINAIDSLIILNRRTMAIGQWLIPNGCGVPNGYINGRPGLNIPYNPVGANGAKPEKIAGTPLPQQVYQERDQAVSDLKRISMTQDVLEGTNPTGVKTAYQLEQLLENALASLGATFQRWEKSFEREETKKLLLIAKKYKEPREGFSKKLKAINKDITNVELEMFIGSDLQDNVNVRVEANSSIPRSKAGENAVLRELVQNGILDVIQNSVNKREFLDKMGIKGFDYQSSPDVRRAQWENAQIEEGNLESIIIDPETGASVLELDDHETHIVIHSSRIKDPNISLETRKKYLIHIEEHLTFLKTAAQADSQSVSAANPQTNVNREQAETAVMEG